MSHSPINLMDNQILDLPKGQLVTLKTYLSMPIQTVSELYCWTKLVVVFQTVNG